MRLCWRWWWGASLLVHSGLVAVGFASVPRRAATTTLSLVTFELPPPSAGVAPSSSAVRSTRLDLPAVAPGAEPEVLGGARSTQNINADNRGERGDGRSLEAGRLLAARAEAVNLSPNLMNTLAAQQEQRIRTARDRVSPQDRRSTPNPGYDPWISSSEGVLLFRVCQADALPARGAAVASGRAIPAGASARAPSPPSSDGLAPQATPLGATPRPTAGVAVGLNGHAPRVTGPSATGHASIEPGHVSTTADLAAERPRDNLDAEALATNLVRNALATSIQSGPVQAAGRGGVGGGGAAGSGGGQGAGGQARPYGEDDGWLSLRAPDARYLRYFQQVRRTLDPLWADAFPREEMLRMRQGRVIVRFVIEASGRVRAVQVRFRSGISAFDRNVASAVAAAHLPPIPPELHRAELPVEYECAFRNPLVR